MTLVKRNLFCIALLPAAVTTAQALAHADTTGTGGADKTIKRSAVEGSTIFPLPEIVVSARKIEAPPSIIVREVSDLDITAWNAQTAGDALTYVPGVNVQIGGSSGDSRAWIRGFRDRDVLVLYDGIPVASGFEGTIDLNEISLAAVSNIKVMKGAPSVIYGTNGMGGVIDVIPQKGKADMFLYGGAEFGTDGRFLGKVSGGGGNSKVSYVLSASHQQADDYALSDDYPPQINQPEGSRINSDFNRNNLFLRLDVPSAVMGQASLFVNISDAEKGLPIETGIDDPDYSRLTQSTRTTLGLSNQFSSLPLTAKFYYNGYKSDLTYYTDDSFSEVDEVDTAEDYSLGGKLYSGLETAANNNLLLSVGVQKDVFKGEGELENGNKAELSTWVLALEDEYWVNDRLSVAAGAIYTYFDQTRLGQTSSALNPQIALAWQASPALSLHASVAQRTRFPKLRELYRNRYGNPDLKEQTANNYELGLKVLHRSGLNSDFSVFRSEVDDLIERPDRRSLYQNLDRVTLSGVEASNGGWLTDRLYYRVSYTYVDAVEDIQGGGSRQLRSRPRHTVVMEFRYRFSRDILLTCSGISISGLFDLDPEDQYTKISNYFVANAKVSKPISDYWQAYVSVSNLLDEDYQQRIGDPREGRSMAVGLDFSF